MPCWCHEAHLATLSNTWFVCERYLEAERAQRAAQPFTGRTSEGALAESPPKAGSEERPETSRTIAHSPPPGAQPERDPAQYPAYAVEPSLLSDVGVGGDCP
jgi:hypothetical protein